MPTPTTAAVTATQPMPRWLRGLIIGAIILGIALRFTNVAHKAFGLDEAFTALRISGYGDRDAVEQLVTGQVITNAELQRFQFPNGERGAWDTVQNLARTAPGLPPPYFLMLRGWVGWFGQTMTSLRLFSVALSVLLIPAIYWLGRELFPGTWVGAIAMALLAQSPFQLLYAQEAQPYSLWALLILLSSAALVRALGKDSRSAWTSYGLTLALGLYCHGLHGLVMVSHAVFMAWREWGRWGQSLRRGLLGKFVAASLLGSLLFAPWILFALVNFTPVHLPDGTTAVTASPSILELVKAWLEDWNLVLLDFNRGESRSRLGLAGLALLLGVNWVWMAIALWRFALRAKTPARQLLLSGVGATAALLMLPELVLPELALPNLALPDFLRAGDRSGRVGDWLPAVVSLQLIMAFVLARWLVRGPRHWGQVLLAGLLTMGLLSNGVMVMSWDWWSKSAANANLELPALVREHYQRPAKSPANWTVRSTDGTGSGAIAKSVSDDIPRQVQPPLFVSDAFVIHALAASHALPNEAQWLLVPSREQPLIPNDYRDFYLFFPTAELLGQMQQQYEVQPFNDAYWQVSRDERTGRAGQSKAKAG